MDVLFLGKDNRYDVVIRYLRENYNVECIGYEDKHYKRGCLSSINKYNMIILPMSGIKNGKAGNVEVSSDILKQINSNCIIYTGLVCDELKNKNVISFLDDDEINYENNKITVDGMMDAIKNKNKKLICILGYGNIGSMIYEKLRDNYSVIVGVKDCMEKSNINGSSFLTSNKLVLKNVLSCSDLIINTVPSNIIDKDCAKKITGHILDIASYPYGIDQELVKKYNLDYHLYSGIPAKFDPERAGKILLKKFNC